MNTAPCAIQQALHTISGKWTISILFSLCAEPKGFNQLARELSGISPRVLSERLKELAEHNLVHKEVFPTNPPTTAYSLTEKGRSLKPILQDLHQWGENHKETA